MEQEQFGRFIAALWEQHGWETTNITDTATVLAGTDRKSEPQYTIHTAEYRNLEVSGETVAQYSTELPNTEHATPVIVTTGQFSWEAHERADIYNLKLVDGDSLLRRIESAEAYDTVNTYSPISLSAQTTPEIETNLNQQEQAFEADKKQDPEIKTQPRPPWLTVLPGITLNQNWIRRFVLLFGSEATLVLVYNVLPASGPVLLQLGRITTYFAILGSIIGAFISFYMDMELVQRSDTYWNPRPLLYLPLVMFSFGLVWLLYFYKRRYHLGGLLATPPTP